LRKAISYGIPPEQKFHPGYLMRSWKFVLPLLASSLCFAAQPDRITAPIDSTQMVPLKGNVHRLAQPQYDQGPVEDSFQFSYVTLVMAPSPSQQASLNQLLAQQQDRSSPNFHKWLSPAQYAGRFGLSQNDVSKITTWLTSQGLQIVTVGGGRNSIVISGTASQIQSAFKTEIHRYNINGEKHIANSVPPSVPSALSGVITAVRGLTDFRPKPMYVRPVRHVKNGPHSSYTTTIQAQPEYFLAPGDIATLYDLNPFYNATPAIDGTGQKLAIIGQTDIYLADIANFRVGFGLNPITGCTTNANGIVTACDSPNFQYVVVGADLGTPSTCGDLVEADLDIEWSGATARNAQIIYVNAPATFNSECTEITNGGGVNAALDAAINPPSGPPLAHVISMSYGLCETQSDLPADSLETEFEQANSEGVTIMNSAGDSGSAGCDVNPPGNPVNPPFSPAQFGLAVSYPASSPSVTAVGGTSIPTTEFSGAYWSSNGSSTDSYGASAQPGLIGTEVPWNDDEAFAALCQGNNSSFCTDGGLPAVPGWTAITSEEIAQKDLWISQGGGGVSNCFNQASGVCNSGISQPVWQQKLSIPNLSSPQNTYRFVPDVSLIASPNFPGYVICTPIENLSNVSPYDAETTSSCGSGTASGIQAAADGVFNSSGDVQVDPSIIGGTSASSPIFAGIVTLLNQYLGTNGLGNINSTLYSLAADPASGAFHSIKSGDNNVYCQVGTPALNPPDVICPSSGASAGIVGFSAANADPATGYNLVNGLGSVDANALAIAWQASLAPDFQFLPPAALSPSPVPAGQQTSTTLTIAPLGSGSTGMVVNFTPSSCMGLPTGASCSFNPPSVNFNGTANATTTLTISTLPNMTLPSAPQTITITPTNSANTTTTVSLSVGPSTESFTIAPTTGSATFSVAAGATVPVSITVSSTTGFINAGSNTTAVPLTFTCTGLPSQSTASFSPGGGGCAGASSASATAVTMNIVTTAPTAQARPPLGRGSSVFYALLLPGLFGVVFSRGSRTRRARLLGLIVVIGFSTLWLGSCSGASGGGQKNAGTAPGTYVVVVNATTGGANPLTGSFTVNLTVTP
jgi:subtilase family serine protease